MGSKTHTGGFKNTNPGPGQYQADPHAGLPHPPTFSIRPKTKTNENSSMNPGPGAYNPELSLSRESKPKIAFGTEPREKVRSHSSNPGPGTYQTTDPEGIKPNGPQVKFGTSTRSELESKNSKKTPAPGQCNSPLKCRMNQWDFWDQTI